jgi:hypothetical protein
MFTQFFPYYIRSGFLVTVALSCCLWVSCMIVRRWGGTSTRCSKRPLISTKIRNNFSSCAQLSFARCSFICLFYLSVSISCAILTLLSLILLLCLCMLNVSSEHDHSLNVSLDSRRIILFHIGSGSSNHIHYLLF